MINDLLKWQEVAENKRNIMAENMKKHLIIETSLRHKQKSPAKENFNKQFQFEKQSKVKQTRQFNIPQQGLQSNQQQSESKIPFFTLHMTKSQIVKLQSYEEKQQKKCQIIIPTTEDIDKPKSKSTRNKTKSPEKILKEQISWKPCLPNFIYFSNKKTFINGGKNGLEASNLLQTIPIQSENNTPQHAFIDVRVALKNSKGDQKTVTAVQLKEIVSRLNQWYEKKLNRIENQQAIKQQKEINACTFQPQIIRKKPALSVDQQCLPYVQEEKNYLKIFAKKLSRVD